MENENQTVKSKDKCNCDITTEYDVKLAEINHKFNWNNFIDMTALVLCVWGGIFIIYRIAHWLSANMDIK